MDNKKKNFAIHVLRKSSLKWRPRTLAKNRGRKQFPVTSTNKKGTTSTRMIWHYNCKECGPDVWYRDKQINIDHIAPVVDSILGWQGFDVFIDRLFVEESELQRLCIPCHNIKSGKENIIRDVIKKATKKKK